MRRSIKYRLFFILILSVLLLLYFTSFTNFPNNTSEIQSNIANSTRHAVKYVIDGDTLVLDTKEKVRLLGVDASEISSKECFSSEAKVFLSQLTDGKNVNLEQDSINSEKDKYGRLLRYVIISSENINLILIREGYARYYRKFPIFLREEFDRAEREAKKNRKGLWGECN